MIVNEGEGGGDDEEDLREQISEERETKRGMRDAYLYEPSTEPRLPCISFDIFYDHVRTFPFVVSFGWFLASAGLE